MKRILFLMMAICSVSFAQAQKAQTTNGAALTWEEPNHDFGEVEEGKKVEFVYKFTNTGNEPLIITNVQPTCGCTLPKSWPRGEIMPGQSGELLIAFDSSNKSGKLSRVTTIVSNAVNDGAGQIKFTANVTPKKVVN